MSLSYAMTYFCDAMLYFAALGFLGLLRACGMGVAYVPILLAAGCWACGRLAGRGRLRWLGLAVIAPCPFLAGNVAGALASLPMMVYLPLYVQNNQRAPDYYYAVERFRHSLIAAVGILLVAALVSAGTWEKGLPYLFLYVTLSLTLLRLLRHDDRVARSRRFRIMNLTGVVLVCMAGFALSRPEIVAVLRRLWLWFAEHVLLNLAMLALYAIQWILYGASWLFTRLFGNVRLRELDLSGLDMGGPAQPMFSQAESAVRELPLLVRLAIQGVGIALLAALAFLVLRAVSRRVVRTEMSSGGSDQRESLDDGPASRGARFSRRDPVDGVRRQYRRVLTTLRARGGRVTPAMNTQQIQQENVHIADPGALKAIRDVYLPVRYGGRAASSQDIERARIAADRIRKS